MIIVIETTDDYQLTMIMMTNGIIEIFFFGLFIKNFLVELFKDLKIKTIT